MRASLDVGGKGREDAGECKPGSASFRAGAEKPCPARCVLPGHPPEGDGG